MSDDKPTKKVDEMDFDELVRSKRTAKYLFWIFFIVGAMLTTMAVISFIVAYYKTGIFCMLCAICLLVLLLSISILRGQIDERLTRDFRGRKE